MDRRVQVLRLNMDGLRGRAADREFCVEGGRRKIGIGPRAVVHLIDRRVGVDVTRANLEIIKARHPRSGLHDDRGSAT